MSSGRQDNEWGLNKRPSAVTFLNSAIKAHKKIKVRLYTLAIKLIISISIGLVIYYAPVSSNRPH